MKYCKLRIYAAIGYIKSWSQYLSLQEGVTVYPWGGGEGEIMLSFLLLFLVNVLREVVKK